MSAVSKGKKNTLLTAQAVSENQARAAFDYWRSRLAPEWAVVLNLKDPTEEYEQGKADRASKYLTAEIKLGKDWPQGFKGDSWAETLGWSDPGLRVEALIVHELLHLTFHDLENVTYRTREHFSRQEWAMLAGEHDHHLERTIERCAFALVAQRHGFHPLEASG